MRFNQLTTNSEELKVGKDIGILNVVKNHSSQFTIGKGFVFEKMVKNHMPVILNLFSVILNVVKNLVLS